MVHPRVHPDPPKAQSAKPPTTAVIASRSLRSTAATRTALVTSAGGVPPAKAKRTVPRTSRMGTSSIRWTAVPSTVSSSSSDLPHRVRRTGSPVLTILQMDPTKVSPSRTFVLSPLLAAPAMAASLSLIKLVTVPLMSEWKLDTASLADGFGLLMERR